MTGTESTTPPHESPAATRAGIHVMTGVESTTPSPHGSPDGTHGGIHVMTGPRPPALTADRGGPFPASPEIAK